MALISTLLESGVALGIKLVHGVVLVLLLRYQLWIRLLMHLVLILIVLD
jgi:hypothetical protein